MKPKKLVLAIFFFVFPALLLGDTLASSGDVLKLNLVASGATENDFELRLEDIRALDVSKIGSKVEVVLENPLKEPLNIKKSTVGFLRNISYIPDTNSIILEFSQDCLISVMQNNGSIRIFASKTPSNKVKVVEATLSKGIFKGNMLHLSLDSTDEPFYYLEQVADQEYSLTIKNAGREDNVPESIVSSEPSDQIKAVRFSDNASDLNIKIFSSSPLNLGAMFENGKLFVGDISNLPSATTTRAQPKIDSGEAGEGLIGTEKKYVGKLISLDLQDTEIANALRIIAEVSNLNIVTTSDVTGKVTLRLIDVPWDQALDVILRSNGLDKVQEGNVVRIAPVERLRKERESLKQAKQAEEELEPLQIKYLRVSYAKASALKPILETVLTDRGSITFDERTNQLIVKDIDRGIKNVTELVKRLDLRTPQVLLETVILEADRNLSRSLGVQFGFDYVASSATGNPLGLNFPNAMNLGLGANFPITGASGNGLLNMIFDSADGTKSLSSIISAYEQEGMARIISRPTLVTTNNSKASIEATEVIRIKRNQGGNQVVVGSGGSASSGSAADEVKVGIKLTMTPQASPDYWVLLDIFAESSSFGSKLVDGIPSTVERKANSTILVSSGQTFILGGIYKITDNTAVAGLPFLKDIPVLGYAFRSQTVSGADEELIFIITPKIVEGSFDDAAMTNVD
ncbi:MAG: type IV pilus secretin PilQ [Deltaproteobacteria bacterium]|nr:type IV pilus secretin PilQ [Deltaproteobacteria bacterium]